VFTVCFWATVCKTVRPICYIGPLSCPVCLSVTLVYCGQTVGRIKMKLGRQVGLCPGHIVLDGNRAPPPKKGAQPPIFRETAGWIKMPPDTKIYAVHGHSRSLILLPIEGLLLVNNTNLPPILHRFRDIAFDKSKIAILDYPSWV